MRCRRRSDGYARRAGVAGLFCCLIACGSEGSRFEPTGGSGGLASTTGGGGSGASNASGGDGFAGNGGKTQGGGSGASGTGGSSGSAGGSGAGAGAGSGGGGAFTLTSPAIENVLGCSVENPNPCDTFPAENVSYGDNVNVSPELHWTGVPPGTQSFALVLFDLTFGQAHWTLWNIPADANNLAAGVSKDTATPPIPVGSRQANANFATTGGDGYFGPHVPCNVFELELYALSLDTFSPMDPESSVLVSIELQELGQSVLGVARLAGRVNDPMVTCE